MELRQNNLSRRLIEQVLALDEDPITKVQQLVDMGVDEEEATGIVERYQIGQRTPVYYEQLSLSMDSEDL